ncbi:VOC family protein [Notoacmeibacter sp. MSK16QG-6]|uniref:VOC family protein n=1 Tax=Notoacmeibacter sp. MSK16QG-6 TaxID=2957982 RepID=UPI0020A0262D|nr:VOC family protein [Notoacmeibacter sp. MSK16QG-6]MCP1198830.1 VOC family protein [Notoacmeibacter sp. MSK16QG-6]
MQPTIYLYFEGKCEEAMRYYVDVFGGEVLGIFRNGDSPDPENRMPGGDDLVMNMAVRIGESEMMASDAPKEWYNKPQGFDISMPASSIEEAQRWFEAISDGGTVRMDLEETFWAERFAMVTDRYGIHWMINYTGNKAPK